jgi:hypothetical protein
MHGCHVIHRVMDKLTAGCVGQKSVQNLADLKQTRIAVMGIVRGVVDAKEI